ncbi:MAG: Vitamin B12 transporter BtuB [Chroococcidiopsis cubana SAG 39.79]|uniref:Ligand-gated channel n=1 Tax=Chroococcidiopsis cubana SAG 39.79 TaxID=388085 RepID=A0AB37U7C9_9CYAN|nr:TonB-dependent siderophore receptor [Chroococcidiopsis cubana]MDZ4875158.1 Vitamin B12 transporter BtuB [Chroococcidiopsis cubana SAG 39.79]PSB53686.1 TonB-dependent siderophore receptor [Chroococcidiopsis cubana CCALA 043]RUS93452.1 ligand-gated channel [Chroococcidiopsis cubana SAG 39.79]
MLQPGQYGILSLKASWLLAVLLLTEPAIAKTDAETEVDLAAPMSEQMQANLKKNKSFYTNTPAIAAQPQPNETGKSDSVQVTGIKLNPTPNGLEMILETADGTSPQVLTYGYKQTWVANIINAQLRLPEGKIFRQNNPVAGITSVTVSQLATNSIRVTVTGTSIPTGQIVTRNRTLVLSLAAPTTPTAQKPAPATPPAPKPDIQPKPEATPSEPKNIQQPSQPAPGEETEIVVTGEREVEGYNAPDASTATKTDTPLRDIPQSIQVIPRQVIEDQQVTEISDALRNVSGVTPRVDYGFSYTYNIRGFSDSRTLRNGFRIEAPTIAPSGIERVEVLKGPASVLYGQVEPGGIINFVTKKPLSDPYYAAEFTAGSYNFYEPSIDFSGPLTADGKLLYRLNASYQNFGSFIDFVDGEILSIAPVISYKIGDATTLTLEYEYLYSDRTYNDGLPIDSVTFELPISRYLGEPGDRIDETTNNLILSFDHRFDDNISLRTAFGASFSEGEDVACRVSEYDPETQEVSRFCVTDGSEYDDVYSWQTDLVAKFNTGSVQHQLLLGLELSQRNNGYENFEASGANINVFDPVYGEPIPPSDYSFKDDFTSNAVGLYLQNQIALLPNLKLLIGGRFDFINFESEGYEQTVGEERIERSNDFDDNAFSPRVGLVYQPIEPISLYASYSRSFVPNNTTTASGELIEPTRGTQYEAGIKAELGNLSATLAAYEITKTNILTTDPDNPDFSIGVGEVKSRGIEFDLGGEILPGWNLVASAFINDAFVTEDNNLPVDDVLTNAPAEGASLWTTYEIQRGNLQGLGFGVGVFYVGDREAELPNELVLPSYVRADASIFYKRDNWRVGLNFKNLFDTKYYESSQNTALIYPGAPFTVLGTVAVEF